MESMCIRRRDVGEVSILELDGRLILDEGELLLRDAVDQLCACGRANVILDLAKVSRIDSAGIGILVSKFLTAMNRGGRLKLLHLTSRAAEMLRMTRLVAVFEVYDSEGEALRSFEPRARSAG
jgi:anti-sigma B factor antagonist